MTTMTTERSIQRFLKMCLSLSAARDRGTLLSAVVDNAIELSNCDAGLLYMAEDGSLRLSRVIVRSRGISRWNAGSSAPQTAARQKSACAWTAQCGRAVSVVDVATDPRFDFSDLAKDIALPDYALKNLLVVPMSSDRGEVIGVIALVNAMDKQGNSVPFTPKIELFIGALTAQAASGATNIQYAEQVASLLDSLVGALSTAIDERTPFNANHTRNMARYATRFLDWLDATNHPWKFSRDKRHTFLLSVWLHDVGKLVVPLSIINKDSRLGEREEPLCARFRMMALLDKLALLENRMDEETFERRRGERDEALAFLLRVNRKEYLTDEDLKRVDLIAASVYQDDNGTVRNWLTEEEHDCLSIRTGTLTAAERVIMESHVEMTERILSSVDFPKMYAQTPVWACMHHEQPNGRGYPRHLSGSEIPPEVRLLTILDIFEAITACDRPYKLQRTPEDALAILHGMAKENAVDGELLELFEQSRAWQ